MSAIGFDCGTYNLVCATRNDNNDIVYKREVNAFLELPLENRYLFNMMKKAGVPLIEREKVAYVVGQAAVDMAYTLNLPIHRPMKDGCLNPQEKDAFRILGIMIHSMIGNNFTNKDVLHYSIPADAVNVETNAVYHQKVLDQIFKAVKVQDKFIQPFPINEAQAIVYSEAEEKQFTAISMSFGSGMVNVCFTVMAQPVFSFSINGSGDWIDEKTAKAIGETPIIVNKEKVKLDLNKTPSTMLERALNTNYRILIENVVNEFKKKLDRTEIRVKTEQQVDVILAGGVSSPNGFEKIFEEIFKSANISINYGKIFKAKEPLYAVAKGCLLASEMA